MKKQIFNASSLRLFQTVGTLPNMNSTMVEYFQPMIFTQILKSVVDFQNVETPTNIAFQGVMQPLKDRDLSMKPEGQRSWQWYWLHAEPGTPLKNDDTIMYQGKQYRIMSNKDYTQYGYVEYHLVQDYTGSGPNS